MKVKSQRDFVSGAAFAVLGVAFATGAAGPRFGSAAAPGSGYFQVLLGILLAGLGGVLLFKALTFESEGGEPIGTFAWRPLLLVVAAVLAFGALLPRLGLVLSVPVLVLVASLAQRSAGWKSVAAMAVLASAGSGVIAVRVLGLAIPVWPAGWSVA